VGTSLARVVGRLTGSAPRQRADTIAVPPRSERRHLPSRVAAFSVCRDVSEARIATAPASTPVRHKTDPSHGSRGAPFGMDAPVIRALACYRVAALAGLCVAMKTARQPDSLRSLQAQIMRPFCQV
jgi:hypothetical protein